MLSVYPDVQYHFHGLDPNDVVDHAYRAVGYLFGHDAPVKPGETIGGLKDGQLSAEVHWPCRYEKALLQPEREVMDICLENMLPAIVRSKPGIGFIILIELHDRNTRIYHYRPAGYMRLSAKHISAVRYTIVPLCQKL